jgi:hypothetical protein
VVTVIFLVYFRKRSVTLNSELQEATLELTVSCARPTDSVHCTRGAVGEYRCGYYIALVSLHLDSALDFVDHMRHTIQCLY